MDTLLVDDLLQAADVHGRASELIDLQQHTSRWVPAVAAQRLLQASQWLSTPDAATSDKPRLAAIDWVASTTKAAAATHNSVKNLH